MTQSTGLRGNGMPTNMEHKFNRVPAVTHPRSTFDRSSSHKMTFDPNILFPCYHDQVYPGDTIQVNGNIFARLLAPLQRPVMDNFYLDWFAFFVPERLCWIHFQQSMGEQANPADSTSYLIPVVTAPVGGWTLHSLGDYFGVIGAIRGQAARSVNAMKFRGYNKIILDWFHDQNLVNSPTQNTGDGPDNPADYVPFTRRKRLDYFTSMLPFAQKGNPVTLAIGGNAPVIGLGFDTGNTNGATSNRPVRETGGLAPTYPWSLNSQSVTTVGALTMRGDSNLAPSTGLNPLVYANLAAAVGITINAFRLFVTTQQFLELNARGGTRYIEQNLIHFGVVSPDARLQRSEFLGGGTIPINVHPVAQTGAATLGTLGAFSTLNGNVSFAHSFVEHGYIIVLAEVRADLTYWQGIAHDYFQSAMLDRYYPVFANIGEEGIFSRELYCDNTAGDLTVFGYQEPWAHLRYKPSSIGGYFRPDAAGSLSMWHLSQDFGVTRPTLNSTFISDNAPFARIVSSGTSPYFILDSFYRNKSTRVLPVFSVPGLAKL